MDCPILCDKCSRGYEYCPLKKNDSAIDEIKEGLRKLKRISKHNNCRCIPIWNHRDR